jgi:biopolymer transport protein ExbD
MNIKRKLKAHNSELHVGPLNDILFILLLFFLIVSTQANPDVIRVGVPKAKAEAREKQTVVVSIDKSENLFVGSVPSNFFQLEADLKKGLMKDTLNPVVVINADTSARHGTVFKVVRLAKKLGAKVVENVK